MNRGRNPYAYRGGRWNNRGFRSRSSRGAAQNTSSTTESPSSQASQLDNHLHSQSRHPCPYTCWRSYFIAEGYNPVTENARLVQLLATYFEDNLGFVDLEVLHQKGSHELDFQELVNSQYLKDSLPTLTDIMKDCPEMMLNAAGVAFTHVVEMRLRADPSMSDLPTPVPYTIIRIKNFSSPMPFSDLKASCFGKFVTMRGTVARIGAVKPFCTRMGFQCNNCENVFPINFPDGRYTPPTFCLMPGCQSQSFTALRNHKFTNTIDWQQIRLQESLTGSDGDSGRVPRTVDVELACDLTGTCVAGDVVTVTGIVKVATQDNGKGRNKDKCTFTLNLRANYIVTTTVGQQRNAASARSGSRNHNGSVGNTSRASIELSTRDLYCIHTIYDQTDVFKLLVHSMCPSIYGHELVKASLLLALFGGCQKYAGSGGHVPIRGDPHILVVGDPGLGKSQMLQAAAAVAPRGVYVCGNTVTSSGLTVTLTKDGGSGDYSLEAGALVLADQGACCIDEFDKMTQQHQALLEAMEQQSVSIAKAGMVCNLPARTAVLAAANPVGGHYNKAKTVAENLRLSGPLLSRFDLVFILLDKPDEEMDSLLSAHVMALHGSSNQSKDHNITTLSQRGSGRSQLSVTSGADNYRPLNERLKLSAGESLDLLPPPLLRKYISYARDYVFPKLTEEAAKVLQDFYIELRKKHHSSDSTPITTRQLESLVRLTEARAKLELTELATESHAQDVIDLMKFSMIDTYSDETGALDFTRSHHGSGMSNRAAGQLLVSALQDNYNHTGNRMFSVSDIRLICQRKGIDNKKFDTLISSLNQHGYLLSKGQSLYELQTM